MAAPESRLLDGHKKRTGDGGMRVLHLRQVSRRDRERLVLILSVDLAEYVRQRPTSRIVTMLNFTP